VLFRAEIRESSAENPFHVFPPSFDLNNPLSLVTAYTSLLFSGLKTISVITPVSHAPTLHVSPKSSEIKNPPWAVPIYTILLDTEGAAGISGAAGIIGVQIDPFHLSAVKTKNTGLQYIEVV